MSKRRPISPSVRFSVFSRDRHTCQYCGANSPDVELQLDHVHPVSLGGDNRIDNLLTACRDCNAGKGARDPGLAMASRPPTYGERRVVSKEDAGWWARLAFWPVPPEIEGVKFEIALNAEDDGSLISTRDRPWVERLLAGLIAVGGVRVKGRGGDEWWLLIEHDRGRIDGPDVPWGLGAVGPIDQAPAVAEVYG